MGLKWRYGEEMRKESGQIMMKKLEVTAGDEVGGWDCERMVKMGEW
jgi:hypothetical protein